MLSHISLIAGCSIAEMMMLPCCCAFVRGRCKSERIGQWSLSVPPEVKIKVLDGTPRAFAHLSRASVRSSFAFRPALCTLEGFAKHSVVLLSESCKIAESGGVVAAQSK